MNNQKLANAISCRELILSFGNVLLQWRWTLSTLLISYSGVTSI
jgi:hypothetical protein